ncbi:MAG: pyridoxamine 5'-phosphate oxidase family protein [Lewinellaceae bacterium]|nr:pyridoxamine 5'-phosphate oxidase family protein [Saprospiraceae bacterium]MCB9339618.1 pyridoxamine 5'-phosphate oxidase family protein [Lewinellaceae bacterium]
MNYAKLAFTDAVKALQEANGSRRSYDRVEKTNVTDGLGVNEIAFIEDQDHFFMASFGENGYPYIQHRGGPRGFLKVLDPNTLAFVDFGGNKQYITVGNLQTNPNVSLILVSYPHRARLKIYAKARVVELADNPELFEKIDPADYPHRPERMLLLEVQAFDWNCPQHITPRYTVEDIETAFAPQKQYIEKLEAELRDLKAILRRHKMTSQ